MSQALETAHLRAWNLATTLMVCVIVFKAGDGFGFMPTSEYDGDVEIVHEFDPHRRKAPKALDRRRRTPARPSVLARNGRRLLFSAQNPSPESRHTIKVFSRSFLAEPGRSGRHSYWRR